MNELEKDILDLQKSMNILSTIVNEQQESFDTLENFIQESKETINESTIDLKKTTTSYNSYITGSILVLLYFIIF